MPKAPVTSPAAIDPSLVDGVFDCYLDWKDASCEVWEAHARWRAAVFADRACTFADYSDALAEEQNAAEAYAEAVASATASSRRRPRASGGRAQRVR